MKEGLEKHFQSGPIDIEKQDLPEVENTVNLQEDAVQQVQGQEEESVLREQVQVEAQETKEEILEEEIVEIGEPVAPVLEAIEENEVTSTKPSIDLPEGIDKLVEFMNETGGTLQDYMKLNQDFDSYEEAGLLKEYYKQTKPHLDKEDIEYLVGKTLAADAEEMEESEYREKRIAIKEELSKAKAHLKGNKEKFYADIKASNKTEEKVDPALVARQEANANYFKSETEKVFEGFKGFSFSLGEGKPNIRYRVDDADKLKSKQSDLNNIIGGFLDEEGKIADAYAYHKALFAMQNADKLAQLFYEQGKADAIKSQAKDSKNIDFDPALKPPSSNTKLKPGQARVIENPHSTKPGIKLRFNK